MQPSRSWLRHYDIHLCGSIVGVVCSDDGSGVGGDGVGRASLKFSQNPANLEQNRQ